MTRRLLPASLPTIRVLCPAASVIAIALVLVFGGLVAGCSNPSGPDNHNDPPPFTLPRTSPENVLYDFRAIYDGADASVKTETDTLQWGAMYQSLFHPDTFKFYFVPGDQPPGQEETWWGLNDEVNSFKALLLWKARGTIDDIKLSWTVNASGPDNRINPEPPFPLLHPTWRHIYVTGILLDVVAGQNTFRVPNGTADFYFAPDPADSTLWVITEWYDHQPVGGSPPSRTSLTGEALAPGGSTWGLIKGLFYY